MAKALKFAKNPQAAAEQMLVENPQLQAAVNMANGNYQKAFELKAQELGVNPNDILDLLK